MNKILFIASILMVFCSNFSIASEIKAYSQTENKGFNKFERIGIVENYLVDLSKSLKKMEEKLDQHDLKIKTFDDKLKIIDELKTQIKPNVQTANIPKDSSEILMELENLKADIISIKNKDIDPLKLDVSRMNELIRNVESMLKTAP